MDRPLLKFNVTKRFRGFALRCEAAFDSGATAIFGPTGSGKTTLLNCLAGLVDPDEGEIEFCGNVLYSSSRRKKVPPERRRFGYVTQSAALFPHMSVRDNIMYGYRLTPPDQRRTSLEQLVELFRLAPLMDRGVANLSGGERQRVALARALATSPNLLLLDEPLVALDAAFRGVIMEYLKRVQRELKTPMVYVSHSISEVMALAENALVLMDGRPVAQGRASQVLVHPAVSPMADYATLENLLEAEVLSEPGEDGLAVVRVGDERLFVHQVYRSPGEVVMVSIRAGDIILTMDVPSRMSARNVVAATIEEVHVLDSRVLVYVDVGTRMVVEVTSGALRELGLRRGQRVYLVIKTNSILVLGAPDLG